MFVNTIQVHIILGKKKKKKSSPNTIAVLIHSYEIKLKKGSSRSSTPILIASVVLQQ